jgi:hypothetical protein
LRPQHRASIRAANRPQKSTMFRGFNGALLERNSKIGLRRDLDRSSGRPNQKTKPFQVLQVPQKRFRRLCPSVCPPGPPVRATTESLKSKVGPVEVRSPTKFGVRRTDRSSENRSERFFFCPPGARNPRSDSLQIWPNCSPRRGLPPVKNSSETGGQTAELERFEIFLVLPPRHAPATEKEE